MIKVKNIKIEADKIILNTDKGNGFYSFSDSLRLKNATQTQRRHFTLSPFGIHWAELDEDLCFDGFVFEKPMNDTLRYL
ncbi:MAG: DUF2442 domain-containing protein [Paludibacter sp.]|jgi:hypothetical protein|nr:DUF2442 domain-containing protein [Paludibacter sp.]